MLPLNSGIRLSVRHESFRLARPFTIARGTRTDAEIVAVEIFDSGMRGRGECVPYSRYGHSVDSVIAAIENLARDIENGLTRDRLQEVLPPGPARNALDCALWEIEAKRRNLLIWHIAGLPAPSHLTTAFTIGVGSVEEMRSAAVEENGRPLLKIKLSGTNDVERVTAVHLAAPKAKLIVDANESWDLEQLADHGPRLARLGVALIEQPLPAGSDDVLSTIPHPVPLCADESCHTSEDLDGLVGRYEYLNLKLDKTGGFTEALKLRRLALDRGFGLMVGCLIGTSLGTAPAVLLAQQANLVDLDGPLLLARDRQPGLRYDGSRLFPPNPALWG